MSITVKTLSCEDVSTNVGAYALGALSAAERDAIAQHLAACPRCAASQAEHARTAVALLHATPQVTPPAAVKSRLMAALAERARPEPWWRRLLDGPLRSTWARAGMTVAAVSLAIVAAFVAISPAAQAPSPQALAAQLAEDASARALRMVARDAAPAASGVLRFRSDGTIGVLQAQGLPALADDRVYQLWLVRPDGSRDTGALFRGPGDILVTAPQAFSTYARFGVTVEPAGGSSAPTGPGALGL